MAYDNTLSPIIRRLDQYRDLLPLLEANPERYPYLLESASNGPPHARYDILFAFPGERLVLESNGQLTGPAERDGFLPAMDKWWGQKAIQNSGKEHRLPFIGGWFIYLGYELAGEIEPHLEIPSTPDGLPTAFATRIPAAIIRDHKSRQTFLVAEPECEALIEILADDLELAYRSPPPAPDRPQPRATVVEEQPERYLQAVGRAKQYIVDGDIFQANLSRLWSGACLPERRAVTRLYRSLRRSNAAPFAGLACFDGAAIVSSSPERLVAVRGGTAEIRPIAGTRPRDESQAQDLANSSELIAHPKEQAEHVMLIDLGRNDLGRICVPGSIEVNELMVLESFAHVHHIVSNVRGRLRPGVTPGEVIRAVFPGGTITGCPKVRCMEIIAELEGAGRGAYTGSMGYLNRDGSMDLNILIRTLVVAGGLLSFRAGAGIVADSVARRELDETRAKARGLLLALNSS